MAYPPISNLPSPPSRQDPANFADEADAFLGALPTFQTQVNAAGTYVDGVISEAAAALVAANLPSLTGRALDAVRVNAAANGVEFADVTAAGWALLDDANAAAQRVTLGAAPLFNPSFQGTTTVTGASPRIVFVESDGVSTHDRVAFIVSNGRYNFQTQNNDGDFVSNDYSVVQNASGATEHIFRVANTEKLTLNNTGLSIVDALSVGGATLDPVGSAPLYACRAWVNFNGTGTVAIRASGNVSSVTDVGVGNYKVNFATAMEDENYSAIISHGFDAIPSSTQNDTGAFQRQNLAGSFTIFIVDGPGNVNVDASQVMLSVFR
jgi:hypothetical protein